MKKRFLALLLIATMVLTMGVACKTGTEDGEEEQTKLVVSYWDYNETESFGQIIAAFEAKYPNITIEVYDVATSDYTSKVTVMLNAGSDLDVVMIKDGDTTIDLINNGQLADLSSFIANDNFDLSIYNGTADYFAINGGQYALPVSQDYYVLYYNKDIFDAAGVDYPTNDMTWTQFQELAAKLTSGSGTDKIYGAHFHTWQAMAINWAHAAGYRMDDYSTGYDFYAPYYQMILDMQEAGTVMDYGTIKAGSLAYKALFEEGTIAMLPMGTFMIKGLLADIASGEVTDLNWGIAALPHAEEVEAGYTVGSVTPAAINAASKNQEAAWLFLQFLCGEEGSAIFAANGQIPAVLNETTLAAVYNAENMTKDAYLEVTHVAFDRPIAENITDINSIIGEEHSLILTGELTIEEGLKEMTERVKQLY